MTPLETTKENARDVVEKVVKEDSKLPAANPRRSHGGTGIRQHAEQALKALMADAARPAILLARDWRVLNMPHEFEMRPLYQEVAEGAGCFVTAIQRPESGGLEHLLFMTRKDGLTNGELISSMSYSGKPASGSRS